MIEVERGMLFGVEDIMLSMNNLDILDGGHQVKIVKSFVGGKLTECKGSFHKINSYKVIESKSGSIRDVLTEKASSFQQCLVGNVNSNAPNGMPEDILHSAMRENATKNASEDDEDEEDRMDANEMTRQQKGLKLEAVLKHMKLDLNQQHIVKGAIYGSGPLHEVLASGDGGTADQVTRKSMQKLWPRVWLNDEVVNFFLKNCLRSREEEHGNNTNQKRSHFFNSFFMQNLFDEKNGNANQKGRYNYRNVKTWYRNLPGKNIFNLERIFFPANVNSNHWTLTVVFMEEKRIQYYDSLNKEGGNGEKYLNGILAYLQDEHKRQFKSDMDISGWSLVPSTKETPQQTKYNDENVYDCGVFVCLFADFIALDCAPIFDFDEEYINKCRELISLAIMNECAIDYNLND